MSRKERPYSVLVVSSAEKLNTALSALLTEPDYHPVRVVSHVEEAKLAWREFPFDYVIVNSPLPHDTGIRFAIDAADAKSAVVLLLVRAEAYENVHQKAAEHGVFTLSKPVSKALLDLALDWLESAKAYLNTLEQRTLSVAEKMEELRLVNRAKWLLISELKMDEPHAHRYIEKQAMDRCIPKRQAAEEIIRMYT